MLLRKVAVFSSALWMASLFSVQCRAETIVDANGKTIGTLLDILNGQPYVTRRVSNSTMIYFPVTSSGLAPDKDLWVGYASNDCSGLPYVGGDPEGIVLRAFFLQDGSSEGEDWTKGSLLYPSAKDVVVKVSSARIALASNCRLISQELRTLRPAVTINVSSWKIKIPLKTK